MSDFVEVTLVFEGRTYAVEVDRSADDDVVLRGLLGELGADPHQKYEMSLRGALSLKPGAIIEIRPASGADTIRKFRRVDG